MCPLALKCGFHPLSFFSLVVFIRYHSSTRIVAMVAISSIDNGPTTSSTTPGKASCMRLSPITEIILSFSITTLRPNAVSSKSGIPRSSSEPPPRAVVIFLSHLLPTPLLLSKLPFFLPSALSNNGGTFPPPSCRGSERKRRNMRMDPDEEDSKVRHCQAWISLLASTTLDEPWIRKSTTL
ncbi:hypothetical protein VNO77_34466 [Canavalia gladiata]|uniref:Uncharacterized protein n=1 Tax=Canavalia gladiata TaxID=3824 RepID=A0AAN9KF62_CANGL